MLGAKESCDSNCKLKKQMDRIELDQVSQLLFFYIKKLVAF